MTGAAGIHLLMHVDIIIIVVTRLLVIASHGARRRGFARRAPALRHLLKIAGKPSRGQVDGSFEMALRKYKYVDVAYLRIATK